jgi:hypothetical protein
MRNHTFVLTLVLCLGLCAFELNAAPRSDMEKIRELLTLNTGIEKGSMEISITDRTEDGGYDYKIIFDAENSPRTLVIERKGDGINRRVYDEDSYELSYVDRVIITTRFIDENADGIVEDVEERSSKNRYWARMKRLEGREQLEYDRTIRVLIRELTRRAPI